MIALCAVASAGEAQQARPVQRVLVEGIVFDSLAMAPLVAASVQLEGADSAVANTRFSARSDSTGHFLFTAVPPGRYALGFFHAVLDTLGIEAPLVALAVTNADEHVTLAIPSSATLARTECGGGDPAWPLVLGHVHDSETEGALVNATVVARWATARVVGDSVAVVDDSIATTSRAEGRFALCGLPGNVTVTLRALDHGDSTGAVLIRLGPGGFAHLPLYIDRGGRGRARLVGRVVDERKQPLTAARAGTSGRQAATNPQGAFAFESLPAGTRSLEVRAIGYEPASLVIQLFDARTTSVDVVLKRTVMLPAMVTRGAVTAARLAQFDLDKRSSTGGSFIVPPHVAGYDPMFMAQQLVKSAPRVTTLKSGAPMMRLPAGRGLCAPKWLFNPAVPGAPIAASRTIADTSDVDTAGLIGVEVYLPGQAPGRYPAPVNGCGVIVVWTRG